MIKLHELSNPNKRRQTRVGRGIAAGQGKTAGRGTKGQNSRTGKNIPRRFVGGEMSLVQRLPIRRGFKHYRPASIIITTKTLEKHFADGATISPDTLFKKGIIKKEFTSNIKIVKNEPVSKNFIFDNVRISRTITPSNAKTQPK